MSGWWRVSFEWCGAADGSDGRVYDRVETGVPSSFAATETEAIAFARGYLSGKGQRVDLRTARIVARPDAPDERPVCRFTDEQILRAADAAGYSKGENHE